MELAAYFLNWAIWLLYPWNANSAQCKVKILGRSWPLQPLRKCLLTSSCLSTHRCACACTCAHNPKISSLADLGKRKFSDVFTQRKSRVREFKEFSGRLVPMYPAYGTKKSMVRSKCTSEWKDNISHKQLKHIGVRQIAEIQWHFVTSQVLSIWERPSGIYGIPVVHKNIWLPQCWRRDSYIFNVAVFTCVPC